MRAKCLCCAFLVISTALAAYAQDLKAAQQEKQNQRAGARSARALTDREDSRALLEQVMIARLSKELALSDEQTVLLVRRVSEYREAITQLRKKRTQLVKALKNALQENLPEEKIRQKLDAIIAHDTVSVESRQLLVTQLGGDLTAWQQGKLYLFMADFEADMRRLMQRAKDRHAGMRAWPENRSGDSSGKFTDHPREGRSAEWGGSAKGRGWSPEGGRRIGASQGRRQAESEE